VIAAVNQCDFEINQRITGDCAALRGFDDAFFNRRTEILRNRAAGRKAFRAAMDKAKPTLLEPIMDVEVFCPQEVSGDIMGDLNSRRGRVSGMDMRGKQQVIKAQVPLSEMLDYQGRLNSMTQARGSYHMQFSHYDPLPQNLTAKVIEQAQAEGRIRAHDEEE